MYCASCVDACVRDALIAALESIPARPEADERIEPGTFTLDEAMAMVARGEIREGKTLVALLLEAARRGQ